MSDTARAVAKHFEELTAQMVSEPNEPATWLKLRRHATEFLMDLWRKGELVGASADEAFAVACGLGFTMTQEDIDDGRLILVVGMATVRPAEFVVLRFVHPH